MKGPNDAYIQQLMEDYDVKIVFPPPQPLRRKRRLMDHVGDVKVSGQVGDVERACDELMVSLDFLSGLPGLSIGACPRSDWLNLSALLHLTIPKLVAVTISHNPLTLCSV